MTNRSLVETYAFLRALDGYKSTLRSIWTKEGRQEDDAAHSWSVCMMLLCLERELQGININHAIRMALIHDLPELRCGDAYFYDDKGREGKEEREESVMRIITQMAPGNLGAEFHALWREYEDKSTYTSRIVQSLDKLEPIIQIVCHDGESWARKDITLEMLMEKKTPYMNTHPSIRRLYDLTLTDARGIFERLKKGNRVL